MRVVIAEDEALMRGALTLLVQGVGFDVVAVACDGDALVRETLRLRPDLVITDIQMPPDYHEEGLRAALRIKNQLPRTGVMMLSHHVQSGHVADLLGRDASGVGYLLKQRVVDVDSFARDLTTVAAGGVILDPEVVALLRPRTRGAHGRRSAAGLPLKSGGAGPPS